MKLPFKKKIEVIKANAVLERHKGNRIHELSRLVIIIMGSLIIMELIWKL